MASALKMAAPPTGAGSTTDEAGRLAALDRFDVMDGPRTEAFDRITRLVQRTLRVPIALVTFIDGHRLWFKSRRGLPGDEAPRDQAFCTHQLKLRAPLVVPDARRDPRFADFEIVTKPPFVRFYAGAPLVTPEGHVIGTICAMDTEPRAIAAGEVETLVEFGQIVMDELELQLLANVDPLTGAMSRRAFRDEATRLLALARRYDNDLSCLLLDLDYFKRINDDHGHAVGDRVLVDVAQILTRELRTSDLVGRVGGEEFAVVLPHVGRKGARETAERLRKAVAEHVVRTSAGALQVTASLGIASATRETPNLDTLLEGADVALYRAKEAGRNRIDEGPDADRRSEARHRVLKSARIAFNGRRSSINCTVRNLSETGAGLDVSSSVGIPSEFELIIDADKFARSCRIAWRTDRKLGVEFLT